MKRLEKLICSLLCLLLAGGCHWLMPAMAEDTVQVSYIQYTWNEQKKKLNDPIESEENCKVLPEEENGEAVTLSEGWYVAQGNITYTERLTLEGNVHLILADGCKVTAGQGITVQGDATLTIYAESEDDKAWGSLEATGNGFDAGIGGQDQNAGGTVTIHGGNITAQGGSGGGAAIGGGINGSGTVNIYGGSVDAGTTAGGAAIGGGANRSGTVNIYGGSVDAGTTAGGAAIGGGYDYKGSGGTVTISGGSVSASAGDWGAAIGSGDGGSAESIDISGGSVSASATGYGAAIGSGYKRNIESIDISGGSVNASASHWGAAIGSGRSGGIESISISGGSVSASASNAGAAIGKGDGGSVDEIIITGGRVSAVNTDAGLTCFGGDDCEISLGWTAATDYVYAGKYTAKYDQITLTKAFRPADAEDVFPARSIGAGDIAGKLLVPPGSSFHTDWTWHGAEFTLPANLREVKANAFEGIKAKTVLVPADVTSVGAKAFQGSGIEKIHFLGANTSVDATAFENCGPIIAFARTGTATWKSLQGVADILLVAVG